MARTRNTDVVATPWFVRLALYALVAVVGLVGVWGGWVDQVTVDSWLTQAGSLAALVGGIFASLNVTRDKNVPDSPPPAPQPEPAPVPQNGLSLDALRDMIAQNRK